MIVCQCRALTDAQVKDAVRDGARTLDAVARACGAGVECGGCHPEIVRLIDVASLGRRRAPSARRVCVGADSGW